MAISIDIAAMEARYGNKTGPAQPTPIQDLYAPDVRAEHKTVPNKQSQIPTGTPVPEGTVIHQVVGRGMAVVPPKQPDVNAPSMAVVPPIGSNRTTLGTYVEVSQTKSNPLVDNRPEINSGIIAPPVVQQVVRPATRKLDLTQSILDFILELGGEKSEDCQKFFDRGQQTIANWCRNPSTIPLGAIEKFLQKTPEVRDDIIEVLEPHFEYDGQDGTWSLPNRGKTSLMVCMPIMGKPDLPFFWAMLYLAKKYECGFDVQADTMIVRSRNMLAKRFLQSGCQWSLWVDCDIAPPIARPGYFRWLTASEQISNQSCEFDFFERLYSHRKPIVGGVYASRRYRGGLVIQPEIKPRSHEDKLLANQIRRGQGQGLAGVEWIGFGCVLVHREVFLEVQRRFPQLAPQEELAPWRFFHPEGDEGEDEAFCQRVRAVSVPIWLDTQLICGHVGNMAFMPEHTSAQMAV
jgi:hypothetical protein